KHDPRALADAKTAHRRGKCPGGRQHETEAMILVREIALQIDELRAGDMAFFEISPARHDLVRDFRVGNEMRRAVEYAQRGVVEPLLERLGLDQKLRMGNAFGCGHATLALI